MSDAKNSSFKKPESPAVEVDTTKQFSDVAKVVLQLIDQRGENDKKKDEQPVQ